jgi:chromosome segregation ATPase
MTQKDKFRAKRSAAARKPTSAAAARDRQARLEAENSALKKQLAAAELKIAMLERQRDAALNRIEWVIDSINSLAESVKQAGG